MTNNLANIYAYLASKKLPDFDVILTEPLTYLQKIIGESQKKVLIVCKKIHSSNGCLSDEFTPKKLDTLKSDRNELNLTGSPLKDDCEMSFNLSFDLQLPNLTSWNKDEELYLAIKSEIARSLITDLKLQRIEPKSSESIWFLCLPTEHDKTILLNLNFEREYNSIGFIKYHGLFPAKSIDSKNLIESHCSYIKGINKINTNITSFFNIKSNMTLRLNWNTSSMHPTLINTKKSSCTLYQNIRINNNDSVAQEFYVQLKNLNIIKKSIIAFKINDTIDLTYTCGRETDIEKVREEIIYVMTEFTKNVSEVNSDTTEIEAVIFQAIKRPYIDLTDNLWIILNSCSNYKNLKSAFNIIFQCAAQRNIINMPTNQNRLAEIIREVSQRRLAIPCLSGTEPLELLLEIGLQKLQKDYEYIFTESKICGSLDLQLTKNSLFTKKSTEPKLKVRNTLHNAIKTDNNQLSTTNRKTLLHGHNNDAIEKNNAEIVGFQNSNFDEKQIEYQLARLAQFHLILEHLLSIQINLNLENVYHLICEQLMQNTPIPFDEVIASNYDEITISLLTDKVLQHIDNKYPNSQKITMFSANKFREVESIFYYNMENILPPNTFPGLGTDDLEMCKESTYFHWNYTKINTRRI